MLIIMFSNSIQQSPSMSQGTLNYESDDFCPEEEFIPDWAARIFLTPEEAKSKKRKVIALLQKHGSPITRRDLAPAIYPKAFDNRHRDPEVRYYNGYEWRSSWMDSEERHIEKTGAIIRNIDAGIRNALNQLEGREEKLELLRHTPLIIRVGETERGEALYAYHGPDYSQSIEALDNYIAWAESHQAKQSQPLNLARSLRDSAIIQGSLFEIQLDPDDLPDDDANIDGWDDLEENR